MVKFRFSMRGYAYQNSLEDMQSAFEATMRALYTEHENNLVELSTIRSRAEAGEPTAEFNEDGEFLYNHEDAQAIRIDRSEFALRLARNAFTVMLHHLWEKAVDDWREAKPKDHYEARKAYAWLKDKGFKLDEEALEFLRMACNAIKHNNSELWDKGREARQYRDLFASSDGVLMGGNSSTALLLKDAHIENFIDALKRSGLHMSGTTGL